MISRAEHLAWCKRRALEYVDAGDLPSAVTSMMSDLGKHPGTASEGKALLPLAFVALHEKDPVQVRAFINGFV